MKRLLNTLFVTTQGAYLSREGETVLVRVEHETKLRVPVHTLGGIVCFGQVSASPPLMELCGESNVKLSFMSEKFRLMPFGAWKEKQPVYISASLTISYGCRRKTSILQSGAGDLRST